MGQARRKILVELGGEDVGVENDQGWRWVGIQTEVGYIQAKGRDGSRGGMG